MVQLYHMVKIFAISGGVDSVAMLHMFASQQSSDDEIVVAHFNHGIRKNAGEDAEFVRKLAYNYGLEFYLGEGKLGEKASEADAREARYGFLHKLAQKLGEKSHPAPIYTAHHLDDLIESVAINLIRGTGWRGLAVLNTPGIVRPFLQSESLMNKKAIMKCAAEHNLCYREDPSNSWDEYLRNRIRHQMNNIIDKSGLYDLWQQQVALKAEIDKLIADLLPAPGENWRRDWFKDLDEVTALELLRAGALQNGVSATRPQLEDFRQAIVNYGAGKCFNLPNDKLIKFSKDSFSWR